MVFLSQAKNLAFKWVIITALSLFCGITLIKEPLEDISKLSIYEAAAVFVILLACCFIFRYAYVYQ